MKELNELKATVEDGLAIVEKNPNVKEAEVYASANMLRVMRVCYASNIPSNGLEEPKSEENFGASVRVIFKNGAKGFGKEDSGLDKMAVRRAFEKAKRNRVKDEYFTSLPSPAGKPKLKNYHDGEIMGLKEEKAVDIAYAALGGAFDTLTKKRVREGLNITGEIDFLGERMAIANTNGIREQDESTVVFGTLTTIFETQKQDIAGMWFDSSTHLKKFSPAKIGKTSVEKAYALRNGKRIDSGNYDVVLSRQAFADMLYGVFNVSLGAVDSQASAYGGMLGQEVGPDFLDISDDGTREGAIGTKAITDEGLPTGKTEIVREGKLVNYISNDYYTKKYKNDERFSSKNGFRFGSGAGGRHYDSEPGINASNVIVGAGDRKEGDLVRDIKNGIYIGRIWYTYPVNGSLSADFTSTIRGDSYLIRNGKITDALIPNTCRINDNLQRIMKSITGMSKKQEATLAWAAESVVIAPEVAVKDLRIDRIAKGLY